MKKRSQIGMSETIAILFIFFVIVIFGFMFYLRINKSYIQSSLEKSTDLMSIEITQKASFMPELQCSTKNVISDNCIDAFKLQATSDIILQNQEQYYDLFFGSEIKLLQIYPKSTTKKEWVLYSNPIEDTSSIFTPVPILIYNSTHNEYYFAILNITYYPSK